MNLNHMKLSQYIYFRYMLDKKQEKEINKGCQEK